MSNTKKALLVTTVSGFVPQFEMNNVRLLQSMGYEVHYASNYHTPSYGTDNHRLDHTGIVRHQIDFVRSPFHPGNLKVYRQLCRLMREEHFSLVHCHTPMGGVMARLAAHATHTGPVIYTAHGFHFYRGASPIHWLCYYPMERFLSRYTDQQLCINKEDYCLAKRTFHARYINYIPGAGFDDNRIVTMTPQQIQDKKLALGVPTDKHLLLSSGELIKRKNHETILQCLAKLRSLAPDIYEQIHYVLCGHGKLEQHLRALAQKLEVSDKITFLGYREDMMEIYPIADIFLFPSYQEGLPMALLEAMASGLPVICSDIRGSQDLMGSPSASSDLLEYCGGGIMIKKANASEAYANAICQLLSPAQDITPYSRYNIAASQAFSSRKVTASMKKIYQRLLPGCKMPGEE